MERHNEKVTRQFIRSGTIAAAIYNVNRDPKKHPQAITAADIFPGLAGTPREEREATAAEIDMFFTGIVTQHKQAERRGERRSPSLNGEPRD